MRVIGLDVGTKTIGVAISDELRLAAHPHSTLRRKKPVADAQAIAQLVKTWNPDTIVVGMPFTLEGNIGPMAKQVLQWIDLLRQHVDVPVESWDERFSTAGAERVLIQADLSRLRRKQIIDQQAAAFMLQGWLDAHRSSTD